MLAHTRAGDELLLLPRFQKQIRVQRYSLPLVFAPHIRFTAKSRAPVGSYCQSRMLCATFNPACAVNRPIVGENVFFDRAYSSGLDFLLSFSLSLEKPFPFTCLVLLPASSGLFLRKLVAGGETYAPEAKVPFLSSLVSSPSAAQGAAKDLWSS